ncbi:MAG: hypothetical protein AAF649_10645 [Verrucomicrobiota bacterium]
MRALFQRHSRWTVWLGAVCLLLLLVGAVILHQQHDQYTETILEELAEQAGISMDIGEVDIRVKGQLTLRNIDMRPLGKIDFLEIVWDWKDLLGRHIEQVRVHGVQLRSSELQRLQKDRGNPAESESPARPMEPFTLGKLIIGQAVLVLDDLGTGIPPVPIRLGEVTPLVFDELYLGGESSDPAAMELQKAEVNDLVIYSPYDPLAKVIAFEKITLVFSWAGIQERQMARLAIEKPVIFAGEELFWLVKEVRRQKEKEQPAESSQDSWSIGDFQVIGGQLVVTALGNPGFTLPVIYGLEMSGLVLSDFSSAPLKLPLEIPPTNLNYPEYGVRISNLRGSLEFSLPPGEETQDNLVNTIKIDSISWKGVTATNAWTSVTLDENGIYCELGADTYGGYTNGNLSIMLDQGMKWFAGIYVRGTEVRPVAEKLAPEYIRINGAVSADLEAAGQERLIQQVSGKVDWLEPGNLEIVAVDDLLDKLPEDWIPAKQDAASIALKAFRDYDYKRGQCLFSYAPPASAIGLNFEGEQGKRNFEIKWHDLRENPGFGW